MGPRQTSTSWWLWAGCATAGACTYYLLRPRQRAAVDDTDFAGFLTDPAKLAAPAARSSSKAPAVDETGFNAFLRFQPAAAPADPTGFDSFLRVSVGAAGCQAQSGQQQQQSKQAKEEVPLDRAGVLVMYGTEYGFSKEIAEKLCSALKAGEGFWPRLVNMADYHEGYDFSKEQAVLMVCSTQGDGVPPSEPREFCDWVFAGKAGDLSHLHYSVLALGDTSYPHFCRCGKQLDAALAAAGARAAAARVDVDKEDWGAINGWLEGVQAALLGLGLRSLSETGVGSGAQAGAAAAAAAKRYSKSRPYFAGVRTLEGLCVVADRAADKDTVRVELDLGDSGLQYHPGDALGVYPTNDAAAVGDLLSVLGVTGDELVPVPSWHYQEPEGHATVTAGPDGSPAMPLRAALSRCYDLRSPRGDALLRLLLSALQGVHTQAYANGVAANGNGNSATANGNSATSNGNSATANGTVKGGVHRGPEDIEKLLADKAALDAYLEPRHAIDVLRDYSEAARKLSPGQLLPALRQLQPRLYSISSSPLEDPRGVQATIAVVKYTSLGEDRVGVCSTFVAERTHVGDVVPLFITKNPDFRLPKDPATPIIMVGPGTGLAPFRAFIVHRLLQAGLDPGALGAGPEGDEPPPPQQQQQQQQQQEKRAVPFGPMVLYFGCRRRDQDYLYGSDLERWAAAGAVELHTAFSREPGRPKVYVQRRLEETADRVWELLQSGGHFYVCGDANSMAGAVERALLGIIAARLPEGGGAGGDKEAAARAYLQRLSEEHRYERDVWFS